MAERGVVTIRRQVVEVDLHGTESDGHALQRRLPRVCAEVVTPAIESALGASRPGRCLSVLDRLTIDLTLGSLDRLEADLAAAVASRAGGAPPADPDGSGAGRGPDGRRRRGAAPNADRGERRCAGRVPADRGPAVVVPSATEPDARASRARRGGVLPAGTADRQPSRGRCSCGHSPSPRLVGAWCGSSPPVRAPRARCALAGGCGFRG